jgi:hypothetical protein
MDSRTALILIFLAGSASALNDAYLTVNGNGVDICLAVDSPDNAVCNQTEYLRLDGTRDHYAFFLPPSGIPKNASFAQKGVYAVTTPVNLLGALAFFVLMFGVAYLCVSALMSAVGFGFGRREG